MLTGMVTGQSCCGRTTGSALRENGSGFPQKTSV
jgi:hypothetical protein